MIPKIYVISLTRAVERRRHMEQQLAAHVEFEWIDAIDARDYSTPELLEKVAPERRTWTHYLRPGAIACALSHRLAYIRFLGTQDSHCLILEDDASLAVSWTDLYMAIEGTLTSSQFDVVLLGSISMKKIQLAAQNQLLTAKSYALYSCVDEVPGSAFAYLMNRNAAKRISEFNFPVKATADSWGGYSRVLGLQIGVIKPDLFKPGVFESTIDYVQQNSRTNFLKIVTPVWLRQLRRKFFYFFKEKNIRH